MEDEILRAALGPSDECLSVEQLGRYADGALGVQEQGAADTHIRGCLSCQAELALLLAVTSSGVRPDEAALVRDGVVRLDRRSSEICCRSCATIVTVSMVSVRHVSCRRRGSCFADGDCRRQLRLSHTERA